MAKLTHGNADALLKLNAGAKEGPDPIAAANSAAPQRISD